MPQILWKGCAPKGIDATMALHGESVPEEHHLCAKRSQPLRWPWDRPSPEDGWYPGTSPVMVEEHVDHIAEEAGLFWGEEATFNLVNSLF